MTDKQAAGILGVSKYSLDQFIRDGKLTVVRTNPRRFDAREVYSLERDRKDLPKSRNRKI